MKVAILHSRLSGYLASCLRELKCQSKADLLIYTWPNQANAPFEEHLFSDLGVIKNRKGVGDLEIRETVSRFSPDIVLTAGWMDAVYMKVCRALRKKGIPVIAGCDNQWSGSLRQHLAGWTSRFHIKRTIDVLWVTGERQRFLAQKLGYSGERCWDGYYACDWNAFSRRYERQPSETAIETPHFLFVGRYIPEKGLDTLAKAYSIYRRRVEFPWRLICAGAGPLGERLIEAGAEDRGFIQPDELPALMGASAAFILPSRFEPWGVVAHEAAAAGLPLILSDACGAGVHLLRHHGNGYLFPAGDANALARQMERMSCLSTTERGEFGELSFQISKQYTPHRWVHTLLKGVEQLNLVPNI